MRINKSCAVDHWDGQKYKANSLPQQRAAEAMINRLSFNGSERILDIGCGDGRISLLLAEKVHSGGSVLGMDRSASMYAQAQKHLVHSSITNLSFALGDVQQLGFQDEFDVITGFSFFHWVEDQQTALRNFNAALKPGGKVYLLFNFDHGKQVQIDDSITYVMNLSKWSYYLKGTKSSIVMSSTSSITELITKSGFLLKKMEMVVTGDKFESKESLIQWIFGWLDLLKFIPDSKRYSFITEIADNYLEKVDVSSDGSFMVNDYMMELILQKKL